jgi:shikimate kinase
MAKIFLIGFMGSGKSTVGRQLATQLQYHFVDLDTLIEQQEKATIAQLFTSKGESYFREQEAFYLRSLKVHEKLVVATGGGCPCYHDNMDWMNVHGVTVYLEASVKLLADRLKKEKDNRPLLQGKSPEALADFIQQKLSERITYYQAAQISIPAASLNGRTLAQALRTKTII